MTMSLLNFQMVDGIENSVFPSFPFHILGINNSFSVYSLMHLCVLDSMLEKMLAKVSPARFAPLVLLI